jgi:hypothetical protein
MAIYCLCTSVRLSRLQLGPERMRLPLAQSSSYDSPPPADHLIAFSPLGRSDETPHVPNSFADEVVTHFEVV